MSQSRTRSETRTTPQPEPVLSSAVVPSRRSEPDLPMQQRAVDTRVALIEGAASVVVVDGGTGSMNMMLAASGRTEGTSYFHFASKDELVDAISDEAVHRCRFVADHTPTTKDRGDDSALTDVGKAVRALVLDYVRAAAADAVVRADAILWSDPAHGDHARGGVHAMLHTALLALLAARAAHIQPSTETARATADLILAMLTGVGARPGTGVGLADPPAARSVDRMLTVLLAGPVEPAESVGAHLAGR